MWVVRSLIKKNLDNFFLLIEDLVLTFIWNGLSTILTRNTSIAKWRYSHFYCKTYMYLDKIPPPPTPQFFFINMLCSKKWPPLVYFLDEVDLSVSWFQLHTQRWFMALEFSANNMIGFCLPGWDGGLRLTLWPRVYTVYLLPLHVLHLLLQALVLDFQVGLFSGQVVDQFPGLG